MEEKNKTATILTAFLLTFLFTFGLSMYFSGGFATAMNIPTGENVSNLQIARGINQISSKISALQTSTMVSTLFSIIVTLFTAVLTRE